MTDENEQLPKSSNTPAVLFMPISRRQDWQKWDREITRLEEKCRKLKTDILEAKHCVVNPS